MSDKETAVIVGVGPGLGAALARRFSAAGLLVAIAGRDQSKVQDIPGALISSSSASKSAKPSCWPHAPWPPRWQ
jgi:NAD(P)-dependent dehydrogenase (short-subunit alcohol dehydrogenase family)